MHSNEKIIVSSIDHSKAFDSVDRGRMINTMKEYKIEETIIEVMAKIYQGDSTEVIIRKQMEISGGIRQVCTRSALLFKMVTYKIIIMIIPGLIMETSIRYGKNN